MADGELRGERLKRRETVPVALRTSDLPVRAVSAAVMLAVTATALWLGGWVWLIFVAIVALGVLLEWTRLFLAFTRSFSARVLWSLAGAVYVGVAAAMMFYLRSGGPEGALFPVLLVMAADVGAYFVGRTLGGPKIAPRISPSKTWSGLVGGMAAAGIAAVVAALVLDSSELFLQLFVLGVAAALVAQAGDFFESWMKRRAGVKDSGRLLPGHGGLFDRLDGLVAVLFLLGVTFALSRFTSGL